MMWVILLLYFVLLLSKLDALDRAALSRLTRRRKEFTSVATKMSQFRYICQFLLIPFMDARYFATFTGGGIYGIFVFDDPELANQMETKRFWYQVFRDHNIAQPKLIASSELGQTTQYMPIDSATSYIVKPNRGLGGQGVRSMRGDNVLQLLQQNHEDLIVQERLYACHSAQSFRFVSLFDGTPFVMWQLINNTSFVSNYDNGRSHGEVSLCVERCVGLNLEEHRVLRQMARSLSAVHVVRFSKVFSIGWDLMLDCRTKTAFALEGNISHASWFGNFPNLIDEYKRRCADFHRI
jgi:hypothetical protein